MQTEKKTLVQKIVPKIVRNVFAWMNFHFKEEGPIISKMAKTLPEEQAEQVIKLGKDLATMRSKRNFPKGVRNVAASLLVGQGLWYFVCPAFYKVPEIRDGTFGWLLTGGLDKLFFKPDELLHVTGGGSASISARLTSWAPKTMLFGTLVFAAEIVTDFSRCFIEYWTQKKYGVMADGVARAYGQVRPFFMRYSSLEAYQKMIGYILRPWALGTPNQLFSSFYGILGSIWRTGPQLAVVITLGKSIDKFFSKISEWTGLRKIANRIIESATRKEKEILDKLSQILGIEKFMAMRFQLAAESYKFWKWNPLKPALSLEKAELAAKLTVEFECLQNALIKCSDLENGERVMGAMRESLHDYQGRLVSIFGKKALLKLKPYQDLSESESDDVSFESVLRESVHFGDTLETLQTEREMK